MASAYPPVQFLPTKGRWQIACHAIRDNFFKKNKCLYQAAPEGFRMGQRKCVSGIDG
jgi:hypothetical protein